MKKLLPCVLISTIILIQSECTTVTTVGTAAADGDINRVKALIDQGADVNQRGIFGVTPLYDAVISKASIDIIRLLLDKGADPNLGMSGGWRPLHLAVDNNDANIVKLLIDRGADVRARNPHGKTPLDMAEENDYTVIVEILKAAEIKQFQSYSKGNSVKKSISYNGQKETIAVMDFSPKDVTQSIALTVSELIRTELIKIGRFTVIERSNMKEILKEQGFQQTGCTDTSCAVQVGKLLSAKKILVGSVMKMGSNYMISGRIVDVEKGFAENAASGKAKSESELDVGVIEFINNL